MNLKHKEGSQMRMTIAIIGMAIVAGLLLVPVPVSAHHAFSAAFDENKPINLQGKVTKVELVNPHSWMHRAPRIPLFISRRFVGSRSDVVFVCRDGCNRGPAPDGLDNAERARLGGDGAAPAVDCRGISTDDRLWFASFLRCSIAPVSKHFFSRQNGGAGSFCGQCMDLSQHGRSTEDRVGFRSCPASRR